MLTSRLRAVFSAFVLLAVSIASVTIPHNPAFATNDVTLASSGPATVLAQSPSSFSMDLTATNPVGGNGNNGYNGSFRVVIPTGVTLGSSTPTATNAYAIGSGRVLLFENIGDIQEGSTLSVNLTLNASATAFPVGSNVTINSGFYTSEDPRYIPDFAGTNFTASGDFDGSATTSFSTLIVPIDIEKTSPTVGAENELLRGIHDHVNTYHLEVTNNGVANTNGVIVDDFLPANLEYLGCGGVDNTTDAPTNPGSALEYPGAASLTATTAPVGTCPTPTLVESVTITSESITSGTATDGTDGPTGIANGVYTHIQWDLGTMTPNQIEDIYYQVGAPILANVYDANHFAPGGASDPTANLDNNSGPHTNETATEQDNENWATAGGGYLGAVASAGDENAKDISTFVVTLEDLSIHKSVTPPSNVLHGTFANYSLLIETGEYRSVSNMTVVDTMPDGLCPVIGGPDPETSGTLSGECAGSGAAPSPTLTGLTENVDGSWDLQWDYTTAASLVSLAPSSSTTITYVAKVRQSYQESFEDAAPVNAADGFHNTVAIDGFKNVVTSPLDISVDNNGDNGMQIFDISEASFATGTPDIDKSVSEPTAPGVTLNCDTATWVRTNAQGSASPSAPAALEDEPYAYRPGDRVCYRLGVDLETAMNYRNARVDDFMPPGYEFEEFWGSSAGTDPLVANGSTSSNNATIDSVTINNDLITWTLGEIDVDTAGGPFATDLFVNNGATRFEVIFSAIVGEPLGRTAPDILANLQKFTTSNIAGNTVSLRDHADVQIVEPNLTIDKTDLGVTEVEAETVVPHTITVTNVFSSSSANGAAYDASYAEALNISSWDILPAQIVCADLVGYNGAAPNPTGITLSVAGTVDSCLDNASSGRSVIEWTITSLEPGQSADLGYSIMIPTDIGFNETLVNNTGIRQYGSTSANHGQPAAAYIPGEGTGNIDSSQTPNIADALDSDTVFTSPLQITKEQRSLHDDNADQSPNQNSNIANATFAGTSDEATIGEIVEYRIRGTIPANTTIINGQLTDTLEGPVEFVSLTSATLYRYDGDPGVNALSNGFTLDQTGQQVNIVFPATYKAEIGDAPSAGPDEDDIIEYVFQTRVSNIATNTSGTQFSNIARLRGQQIAGGTISSISSSSLDVRIVQPNISIDKTARNSGGSEVGAVVNGETVSYTLEVTNPSFAVATGDHTSNGYDLIVTDILPAGVTIVGTADGATVTPDGSGSTGGTLTWNATTTAALAVLAPGATATISYDVTVDTPAVSGGELLNTASVSATSLPGTPTGERTTYSDSDTATIVLPEATLTKDEFPFGGADKQTYNVGETADFEVEATVASGTRVFDATLFDTLPAELQIDSYLTTNISNCQLITDAGLGSESIAPLTSGDIVQLTANGQILGWFLGDLEASQDGGGAGDCVITLSYRTHVTDSATTTDNPANQAILAWEDAPSGNAIPATVSDLPAPPTNASAGAWDSRTDEVSDDIDILEPRLEIDKDVTLASGATLANPPCDVTAQSNQSGSNDADGTLTNGCDVQAADRLTYAVDVSNNGDGIAHDIVVVDDVPVGLTPIDATTGLPVGDGLNVVGPSSGDAGIWDATARTITWTLTSIPANSGGIDGVVSFDYDVTVDPSNDLQDDEDLTNTIDVPVYYGMSLVDRTAIVAANTANTDIPVYGDTGTRNAVFGDVVTVEVHFPDLAITKTHQSPSDDTDAHLDESFDWLLTITNNDATATAHNLDLIDVLPTGWTYDANSAQFTVGGTTTSVEPTCSTDFGPCGSAADSNVETLTWTDVVPVLAPGASFTVAMQATPQAAALASDVATGISNTGWDSGAGAAHTNQVTVTGDDTSGSNSCCDPDGVGPTPPTEYSASTTDTVFIRRADLEVTKVVSPLDVDTNPTNGPYWYGSFVNYTISVTNTGPDAAADVVLEDVLDPTTLAYSNVVSVDQGTFTQTGGTGGQWGDWNVGSVPSGATLNLTIRAQLGELGPITNMAEVAETTTYDPDSDPDNAGTTPEDDDDDVAFTSVPSMLGDYVWLDLDGDGVQDASEAGIPGVTVSITYDHPLTLVPVTTTAVTDSLGNYGFALLPTNVPLTVYIDHTNTVLNTGLTGLGPSFDLDGGLNASVVTTIDPTSDADGNGTPGRLDVDFGFDTGNGTGGNQSLGNRVWWDEDNSADATDGVGENGLEGIDIQAVWAGFDGTFGNTDDQTYTTITDATGSYLFTSVPPGEYIVTLDATDLPAGIDVNTYDLDGTGTAHSVSGITIDPNENQLDVDFSYRGDGTIGDTVWYDLNGDGVLDTDEFGIAGATVTLVWTESPGTRTATLTTTTDASGQYLFENLPLGDFAVFIDSASLPAGLVPTYDADGIGTAHVSTLTLAVANNTNLDQDFGFWGTGSIGDTVWFDVDADGASDPAGSGAFDGNDVALVGIDMALRWAGTDGVLDTADDYVYSTAAFGATTDANGEYLFENLPFGSYRVDLDSATLPSGLDEATFDDDGIASAHQSETSINLAAPNDLDQDFSYTGSGELGDLVWLDDNANGIQDAGEAPIENVVVTLHQIDPNDAASPILLATTLTLADGTYLFDNLVAADYVVEFEQIAGHVPSNADVGSDDEVNSDAAISTDAASPFDTMLHTPTIRLMAGQSDLSWDQGFYVLANLGNIVWFDVNINGLQDGGEGLAAGVEVHLLDAAGDPILDGVGDPTIAVTAADGTYLFTDLVPGDYTVRFVAPSGFGFSPATQGSDTTIDSDAGDFTEPAPGHTAIITLSSGETDLSGDAGLFDDAVIGDVVWEDYDLDGIQDADEPGVAEVTVNLHTPGVDATFGTADDVVAVSVQTDGSGNYLFDGLVPGAYRVEVVTTTIPTDMVLTVLDRGTDSEDSDANVTTGFLPAVTLAAGDVNLTLDAGLYTPYDLSIAKTLTTPTVARGQVASFDIVITNDGPGIVYETVTVTDALPTGLSYRSVSAPAGWACAANGNVVTCESEANLAVDSVSTITVNTTVTANAGTTIANTARMGTLSRIGIDGPDGEEVDTATELRVSSNLAQTGSESTSLTLLGLLLIGMGGLLLLASQARNYRLAVISRRQGPGSE